MLNPHENNYRWPTMPGTTGFMHRIDKLRGKREGYSLLLYESYTKYMIPRSDKALLYIGFKNNNSYKA